MERVDMALAMVMLLFIAGGGLIGYAIGKHNTECTKPAIFELTPEQQKLKEWGERHDEKRRQS